MKILVSVRSVEEALLAASGGVDFIDLKEPSRGALGGLSPATIRSIVDALRRHGSGLPVSATIGDVPMHELSRIAARVDAVAACGVDYVKVGIERTPQAVALLDALAASGWPVVPVFIADRGLDFSHVAHAGALGFPGLMVDTADKQAGSLFDALPLLDLYRFANVVRSAGGSEGTRGTRAGAALLGLAGALRVAHEPLLRALAPDFAGFRTAVCLADRSSALDPLRLRTLVSLMHGQAIAEPG